MKTAVVILSILLASSALTNVILWKMLMAKWKVIVKNHVKKD